MDYSTSSQRRRALQLNSHFQFLLFSMCESITLAHKLYFYNNIYCYLLGTVIATSAVGKILQINPQFYTDPLAHFCHLV